MLTFDQSFELYHGQLLRSARLMPFIYKQASAGCLRLTSSLVRPQGAQWPGGLCCAQACFPCYRKQGDGCTDLSLLFCKFL